MLSAAGDIAFTGFNSDGADNLAFVTFVDIPAGSLIYFTDNEWNGSAWADFNESAWSWTASSTVAAGSIVTIDRIGTGAATSNLGSVAIPIAGFGGNRGIANGTETVYAYLGASPGSPTVFLTAIANDAASASTGLLTNTGLTYGVNAINLSEVDAGADVGAYAGPRTGQASLAAYRTLINTASNWVTQDASGDQSADATTPDVPFSTAAFAAGSTLPSLSVNSVALAEGNTGTTSFAFTVTLSAASTSTVTVDYATANGTAADPSDYTGVTGTLTFAPGQVAKTVTVTVNGDDAVEANETFTLALSAPVNATIAGAVGTGTIQNDDVSITRIHDIQGAGLVSPLAGQTVTTTGIVTAVDSNGFYLQARDTDADADAATSEAILVFTSSAPPAAVVVGAEVVVTGRVTEFTPGGASSGNLSTTEIDQVASIVQVSTGNALPSAIVLGAGGRMAPTESIAAGIAFYESLEAMRVTVPAPLVVGATNENGEIWTVADLGANATNLNARFAMVSEGSFGDGLAVQNTGAGSDYNPERIQIDADPQVTPGGTPIVNPGAVLNDVTGVIGYNFGNFEVIPTAAITVAAPSTLLTESTALTKSAETLIVAQYNVLNLDPNDAAGDDDVADGRFQLIAQQIIANLQAPDIIALQEVQDNSGSANDGTVSASLTLQMLVDAIAAAGGPTYSWIDNPFVVNNQVGGEPGGNIRVAYLYNPARVDLVPGSVQTTPDALADFAGSRVPLVATFTFNGEDVTLINNHFSSKGGGTPLMGAVQPAINGSAAERLVQAQNVADYVASLGPSANVVVLGDLNEFTNEESLAPLNAAGLSAMSLTLPELERYSYLFEGNAQELDQTYVSGALLPSAAFDIVHVNAEFAAGAVRASDHDPSVLALTIESGNYRTIGGIKVFDAAQSLAGQAQTPAATDDLAMVRLGSVSGASAGAESVAYEAGKVYATNVNGNTVNIHTVTAAGALVNDGAIELSALPGYKPGGVNSVAVKNGVIAVAYEGAVAGQGGYVALFNAADNSLIKTLQVGVLPDQLAFTPDGLKLVVANEGEAISASNNPAGSVSVISLAGGAAAASVVNTISFGSLDGYEVALGLQGLALLKGQSASADIEPEYVSISADGTRAYVTLQEVNAVAVIDLTDPAATMPLAIQPLGAIDRSLAGNAFDASDQDGIDLINADVLSLNQPDAIASFTVGGTTYFVTANEGDSRVGTGISDSVRLGSSSYVLDPVAYPNAAALKANAELGRLNVLTNVGDTDGDGDFDQIYTLGGRGISIYRQEADGSITKVRETGGEFEAIIAANYASLFNSNQSLNPSSVDSRSDDKGPEPEGVTIGQIGERIYAFVGLERVGGFMVYDVTDPANARFVTYRPETAQDLGPEVQTFISAAQSPTGQALLVSGNEISNTVTLYSLQVQDDTANTLVGGSDADSFRAKGGDDTITGNGGNDAIDGGTGVDTAVYAGAWAGYAVTNDGAAVTDIDPANGDEGSDSLTGVENLRFAGVTVAAAAAVNDAPIGVDDTSSGAALVEDGNGIAAGNALANDVDADLALGLGETLVISGARAGTEAAGGALAAVAAAPLVIDGTYGKLTIAADGSWSYAIDQSRAAVQALNSGQFGAEVFTYEVRDLHGLADTAQIALSIFGQTEQVTGGNGKDTLNGSEFGDLIEAGNGSDVLNGLAGDDTLDGGNGADILTGGLGRDVLIGGNGPDEFVFASTADSAVGPGRDVIADFSKEDTIVLTAIDAKSADNGDQAFTFIGSQAFSGTAGQLRAYVDGTLTIVAGDTNGDGLADFEIGLANAPAIVASNFML